MTPGTRCRRRHVGRGQQPAPGRGRRALRPMGEIGDGVVRTGGDEFVVALHSPGRFDLGHVEAEIRAVAGPVDLARDEPVNLEFSLGLADGHGPVDLDDLVKAADLAAYQDKRERAAGRNRSPVELPTPPTWSFAEWR